MISPPTGFNRLVFGDRFKPVFPSRDPAVYIRLRLGATLTTDVNNGGSVRGIQAAGGRGEFSMIYGLPGKPGYQYTRPFDFFHFEFTAVPNADSVGNAIENLTVRGLLAGKNYEAGDDYRGVWGLFGGYDTCRPDLPARDHGLSLGTVGQWWLTRTLALQGAALGGAGFGAAGTVGDEDQRDYHFGAVPQVVLGLRHLRRPCDARGAGARRLRGGGLGPGGRREDLNFGDEIIGRINAGLSVRLWGPHAPGTPVLPVHAPRHPGRPARSPPEDRDPQPHLQLPGPHPVRCRGVARGRGRPALTGSVQLRAPCGARHPS